MTFDIKVTLSNMLDAVKGVVETVEKVSKHLKSRYSCGT